MKNGVRFLWIYFKWIVNYRNALISLIRFSKWFYTLMWFNQINDHLCIPFIWLSKCNYCIFYLRFRINENKLCTVEVSNVCTISYLVFYCGCIGFFVHVDIIWTRTVHDKFVFHATIISLYVCLLFFCNSDSIVTEIHWTVQAANQSIWYLDAIRSISNVNLQLI